MPWGPALRDLLLLVATLLLWRADATLRADGGAVAIAVALLTGALTTAVAYFAHEWGHFAGALLSGSTVYPADSPDEIFLFQFDSDRNERGQFLAMSMGGFAASGVVLALLLAVLPLGTLAGAVALVLSGLGVLATAILEVPAFWRVLRGAPIPRGGAVYVSSPAA
jgi:hypothetical protein